MRGFVQAWRTLSSILDLHGWLTVCQNGHLPSDVAPSLVGRNKVRTFWWEAPVHVCMYTYIYIYILYIYALTCVHIVSVTGVVWLNQDSAAAAVADKTIIVSFFQMARPLAATCSSHSSWQNYSLCYCHLSLAHRRALGPRQTLAVAVAGKTILCP